MRGYWLTLPGTEPGRRVAPERGFDLRFRLNTFDVQPDKDLVSDHQAAAIKGLVPYHAKVFSVQFAFSREARARVAPRILRDAVEIARQRDLLGDTVQGEIADRPSCNFSWCT